MFVITIIVIYFNEKEFYMMITLQTVMQGLWEKQEKEAKQNKNQK